jgi:hypothetical protein
MGSKHNAPQNIVKPGLSQDCARPLAPFFQGLLEYNDDFEGAKLNLAEGSNFV